VVDEQPIHVQIIGAPIACKEGVKESWREVAKWAAGRLQTQYGEAVHVQYYDLFDADCPALPPDSQLPLVFVDKILVIKGGILSIPLIINKIEELRITH